MIRKTILAAALFLTAAGAARAQAPDPKAAALADEVLRALGGAEAWNNTRFLRFDFAVERDGKTAFSRAHTWDKHTGRYRLEGKSREGDPFVVVMNLNTKEGSAWVKGVKAEGEEAKKQLDGAYAAWVNDTYWLLAPYKMKDPGVILASGGEETKDGTTWDKVVLTFDNVGLTPKDKYWLWVNRQTKLVDRWDYVLKGESTPPTSWMWKGWRAYGAIQLAPDRIAPTENRKIFFPVLEVPASLPDSAFEAPAATAPASGAKP
jgi:hypothetical protein